MGSYKVSYKVLKQQGDDMIATAKLVDGYAEQVTKIRDKLGDDALLAEVRKNLSQLNLQLVESRVVLNTAGEFLVKTVDSYSDVEVRQVKKVDGTKAHNRDFYKNPVVVASAGGAVAGAAVGAMGSPASGGGAGAVGGPVPETSTTTVNYSENYTDNSVNTTYNEPMPANAAVTPSAQTQPGDYTGGVSYSSANSSGAQAVSPTPGVAPGVAPGVTPGAADAAGGMSTAAKAAIGAAGAGAVVAGGVIGGREIKKRRDGRNADNGAVNASGDDDYDPEAELEKALARVRELEKDD